MERARIGLGAEALGRIRAGRLPETAGIQVFLELQAQFVRPSLHLRDTL